MFDVAIVSIDVFIFFLLFDQLNSEYTIEMCHGRNMSQPR